MLGKPYRFSQLASVLQAMFAEKMSASGRYRTLGQGGESKRC